MWSRTGPSRSTASPARRPWCWCSWAPIARWPISTPPGSPSSNRAYRATGVVFLGINSNAHETETASPRAGPDARASTFPMLKDPRNVVADLALVERTPEVIVLDGRARIRYRGAIDDQYGQADPQGRGRAIITSRTPSTPSSPVGRSRWRRPRPRLPARPGRAEARPRPRRPGSAPLRRAFGGPARRPRKRRPRSTSAR